MVASRIGAGMGHSGRFFGFEVFTTRGTTGKRNWSTVVKFRVRVPYCQYHWETKDLRHEDYLKTSMTPWGSGWTIGGLGFRAKLQQVGRALDFSDPSSAYKFVKAIFEFTNADYAREFAEANRVCHEKVQEDELEKIREGRPTLDSLGARENFPDKKMNCPHCNEQLPHILCAECGGEIPEKSRFCCWCRNPIKAEDEEVSPTQRTLCSDGSCIGIINEEGICNVCKKPYTKGAVITTNETTRLRSENNSKSNKRESDAQQWSLSDTPYEVLHDGPYLLATIGFYAGDEFVPVLEMGTTIPCSSKEINFSTAHDNQTAIPISVFQRGVSENTIPLGKFELNGILPQKKGVPFIKVLFKVDKDGRFLIEATDMSVLKKIKVNKI